VADVTITIGADATGVAAGVQEANASLQSIGGFGFQGGGSNLLADVPTKTTLVRDGMRSMTYSTGQAAEAFQITRMEAGRLTAVLTQLGVIPPVIGRSLTMMMSSAFNPQLLGFALGIVVIQGLIVAYQHLGEEAEREKTRIRALADAAVDAATRMSDVVARQKEQAGAPERVERITKAMGLAGMTPEQAIAMQKEAAMGGPGLAEDVARDMAAAWTGRGADLVQGEALTDPAAFYRRFATPGARASAAFRAMMARGAGRVAARPDLAAAAAAAAAPTEGPGIERTMMVKEMAAALGISTADAESALRYAAGEQTFCEEGERIFWDPYLIEKSILRVRQFAGRAAGRWQFREGTVGGKPYGPEAIHYAGMVVHHHYADRGAADAATDGEVKGSKE
jgi:hypothetical protein